jgi:hypothetical protein
MASHPNARAPNTTAACFAGFIPIFFFFFFFFLSSAADLCVD